MFQDYLWYFFYFLPNYKDSLFQREVSWYAVPITREPALASGASDGSTSTIRSEGAVQITSASTVLLLHRVMNCFFDSGLCLAWVNSHSKTTTRQQGQGFVSPTIMISAIFDFFVLSFVLK